MSVLISVMKNCLLLQISSKKDTMCWEQVGSDIWLLFLYHQTAVGLILISGKGGNGKGLEREGMESA